MKPISLVDCIFLPLPSEDIFFSLCKGKSLFPNGFGIQCGFREIFLSLLERVFDVIRTKASDCLSSSSARPLVACLSKNPPHIHGWYDDYQAEVTIKDGIVRGEMPRRALRLVYEWLDLHRDELMENWERLSNSEAAKKIDPLK